jgi:DNA repair protein RecO (recombination protein O)
MSRQQNIRGIIIRKRPIGDKDLMMQVLTEEGMVMELSVKGGNGKSKRKSHLDTLNWIQGTVYNSNRHQYLQEVRALSSFPLLKEKLDPMLRLQLFLEILSQTVFPEDPHPEIYDLLLHTLQITNNKSAQFFAVDIALVRLAHHLGFLPSFRDCGQCHSAVESDDARFCKEDGTLLCHECAQEKHIHLPLKYRKALEFFRRSPQEQIFSVHVNSEESEALREFLPHFFLSNLQKPLKSLALL